MKKDPFNKVLVVSLLSLMFLIPICGLAKSIERSPFAIKNKLDSKSFVFESWNVSSGLPVNSIIDIGMDHRGYLWLTTYEGLIRFDGYQFVNFNSGNTPEMVTNRFHFIYKDLIDPTILWFPAEYGGILRYENDVFTFFDGKSGFTDAFVFGPLFWNDKIIFPTTEGIYEYDSKSSSFHKLAIMHDSEMISMNNGFVTDQSGNLIIFTAQNIYKIDKELKAEVYQLNDLFYKADQIRYVSTTKGNYIINKYGVHRLEPSGMISKVSVNSTHNFATHGISSYDTWLFVTSSTGLSILDTENNYKERFIKYEFERVGNINSVITKEENESLFTTQRGQLISVIGDKINVAQGQGLPDNMYVLNHFKHSDNLWLATATHGLIKMRDAKIRNLNLLDFGRSEAVIGIFEDADKNLFVNIRGGETFRFKYDGSSVNRLSLVDGLSSLEIYSFAQTENGTIYTGINRIGVARLEDGGHFRLLDLEFPNRHFEIRSLLAAPDNTVWVGIANGLFKINNDKLIEFPNQNRLQGIRLQKMALDDSGGLWIATARNGVFYLKEDVLEHYTTDHGLGNNGVRGIYIDRDNQDMVWFATEGGGLSRFNNGQFQTVTSVDGLHNNLLHNITEDQFGRLWMSTNRGVFYIKKNEVNEFFDGSRSRIISRVFQESDGMRNAEGNGGFQNSFIQRKDGLLLYATQGGVAVVDTENIQTRSCDAKVVIEQIKWIKNQESYAIDFPESIIFDKGINDFTIHFTAIDFNQSGRTHLRYKLEGYDNEWKDIAKNQRLVSYTNLPPRTYNFRLATEQGLAKFGNNHDYANLTIIINPLFHQTIWFYLLIIVFVGGFVWAGYTYRLRRYQKQEALLIEKVETRTKELKAEKEEALRKQQIIEKQALHLNELNVIKNKFFSIIAHDLRGPFFGIKGLISLLKESWGNLKEEEIIETLNMMDLAGAQYNRLLQNLLEWARMQFDNYEIHISSVNSEEIIEETINQQSLTAKTKKISFVIKGEPFTVLGDRNIINMVLRNLTSNAIKFSYENSVIELNYSIKEGMGVFEVKDFGMGMNQKQLDSLFNLEQTKSREGTASEKGTGLGLVLSQEMAVRMDGFIKVESVEGEGSSFSLWLPLDK